MAGYTLKTTEDVGDPSGDAPGEVHFFTRELGCEQVAFSHRRMPPNAGGIPGMPGTGHRHKSQEEIYYVISGTMKLKLDDEVIDVGPGTAVRIEPETVRYAWNDGSEDVELVMVSTKVDDPRSEVEMQEAFWP